MVKALGCGPRYLSSILSVHTMPACANWYSGLPQNQVFQSSSLWVGTNKNGSVAQTVEQETENLCVSGSIPLGTTICTCGGIGRRASLRN